MTLRLWKLDVVSRSSDIALLFFQDWNVPAH